jgi:thioredoxin reductase (NADPH)
VTVLNTGIGWHEARVPTIITQVPRGAWRSATARLKAVVSVPVCASNRINTPELAEEILAAGEADLVSLARPLLADPEFVSKAAAGRADEINTCIACNQACLDHVFANRKASCLVNPRACRERELVLLPIPSVVGVRAQPASRLPSVAVVGAGPAGLAAAVYATSDGLDALVLDSIATGGQAATSSRIENYLGFPEGISGAELADRALIQARKFGARISVPAEATELGRRGGNHVVALDDGGGLECRTVLIATGARYRKLDVPRLEEFEKSSVYYAATPIEAQQCVGDPVAVVGGGNSAGQATLFLSRYAVSVHLIVREDELTEYMSRYLADRIERSANIEVLLHSEVRELVGDDELEAVVVEDNHSGTRTSLEARALFVFIGTDPCTGWLADELERDGGGYILTGPATGSVGLLETSRPGVFAAGDVRSGSAQRVAAAVGEGAMAVRLVHEHLRLTYTSSA